MIKIRPELSMFLEVFLFGFGMVSGLGVGLLTFCLLYKLLFM